jgi:hypothetical protein
VVLFSLSSVRPSLLLLQSLCFLLLRLWALSISLTKHLSLLSFKAQTSLSWSQVLVDHSCRKDLSSDQISTRIQLDSLVIFCASRSLSELPIRFPMPMAIPQFLSSFFLFCEGNLMFLGRFEETIWCFRCRGLLKWWWMVGPCLVWSWAVIGRRRRPWLSRIILELLGEIHKLRFLLREFRTRICDLQILSLNPSRTFKFPHLFPQT